MDAENRDEDFFQGKRISKFSEKDIEEAVRIENRGKTFYQPGQVRQQTVFNVCEYSF